MAVDREEALAELKRIFNGGAYCQEEAHGEADGVLCDLLTFLGYEDVVKAYDKIDKWYA